MSDKSRTKYQDVPFIIDGIAKIVKSVSSQTTCADVINKLPKLPAPLAVYASVDGTEKELSKKTKLLKVWRSHSSSQKVVFVVRPSETAGNTLRRNRSRLFGDSTRCEQQSVISNQDGTKDRLKQFSSFIKEKKQRINRRFSEGSSFLHSTLKQKKTSNNIALEGTRLSAIPDKSTAITYQPRTAKKKTTQFLNVKPTRDTKAIIEALTTSKLGFKNISKAGTQPISERTSTCSLRSSDTGYSSASPDSPQTVDQPMKKQTQLLSDTEDGPRHSTPVVQHTRKRRNTEIETTLDEEFDELQGKSLLLGKFMEDQSIYGASSPNSRPVVSEMPENKRRRTVNRLSLPAFTTQEEKCRFLWNQYCDSDSECSDDSFMNDSTMDIAFLDSFDFESTYMETILTNQKINKLRRESAISNLTKFSLHRKEAEIAEEAEDVYDYSFDCSFHRLDESQAAEFGADFHQQFENHADNESDYSVDSFMKTRLDLGDCDNCFSEKADDSFSVSDGGIGSSSSGRVTNVRVTTM